MLDELYASLLKPKHEQYASVTQRLSYFETFKLHATVVAVATTVTACRDAKDDKVLELAVSASVLIIVSGDRDLLTLNPFRGIEILTPRQFVAEFR